jgi:hypothetical protein
VQALDPTPKLHPAAPKGDTLPGSSHNVVREQNVEFLNYDELPQKYRRTELASDEIEAVEVSSVYLLVKFCQD